VVVVGVVGVVGVVLAGGDAGVDDDEAGALATVPCGSSVSV